MGAEKAGNKDGTIPAWDGGYTKVWPGYQSGQPRPDPFASEKPLFQITARNMAQYADQLSDGVKALLQRHPTHRLDVYPTHRTAAAPQWVYDNTFKNATRARLVPNASVGSMVEGAYGGIPFPIPRDGAEAMWNHLLSWHGEAVAYDFGAYVVPANGRPALATVASVEVQYPYYYRDGSLDSFGGNYWIGKITTTGPPFRVGEKTLLIYPAGKSLEERIRSCHVQLATTAIPSRHASAGRLFFPGHARRRRGAVIRRFFFCRTSGRTVSPSLLVD